MKNYKVLLINLERSKSRLALFEALAKNKHFNFERIPAVDKSANPDFEFGKYSVKLNRTQYHKSLSGGEIGCFMSHRLCWQHIVKSDLDYAIVLEDDVELTENFERLIHFIDSVNIEWDYIKLSDTRSRRSFQELFSKDNLSLVSYGFKVPIGTGAQVVSKNGAEKLLAATEVFSRPIDVELQWQSIEKLTTLGIRPPPFKIRHLKSDIDNFGSKKNKNTFSC